jgi:hypothetical protein
MKGPAGRAVWIDGWCTSFGVDVLVHSLSEQKKNVKKDAESQKGESGPPNQRRQSCTKKGFLLSKAGMRAGGHIFPSLVRQART